MGLAPEHNEFTVTAIRSVAAENRPRVRVRVGDRAGQYPA